MATPFVAAASALVLEKCTGMTDGGPGASIGDKVLAFLQANASPVIPGMGGASLLQAGAVTDPAAVCPT
jgi:hypothetical protein